MDRHPPSGLIITDQEALGISLTRILRAVMDRNAQVFSITYAESPALLTPQRINDTDFLVLELFRDYPGGIRAEGLVLAERWMYRKPFLIVSPLHVSREIRCPGYWDTQAKDCLAQRIRYLISAPKECVKRFEQIKERFGRFLTLPPQH
uniref:Response regulatory domain-containing protein n=1 Tax=Candidatus Kentrum sp. MB TaxID=2138164 RepID=A0A450XCL9_9GAMM|nr:MAG: hypothetical protein BECKMB1821G_GA0114241_100946 [Candidatus Kentron sp. MB]VFK27022.1 MAG: hypothetical protein BECKMB1821I_GA0114274_10026 [Candidatus Kentron sp. MB]VFK74938.1 MAG: hypothetical protein BECKMB1821H_GA0114242_101247 [Candidatus Kentron sp. MB]